MQAAADGLPAGLVYDRRADPAGSGYLDGVLFSALYGPAARNCFDGGQDADGQPTAPLASDGALFLSAVPHPAELAVLQCPDRASALSVAALCRARLEGLRSAWAGTDYAAWAEAGDVTVAHAAHGNADVSPAGGKAHGIQSPLSTSSPARNQPVGRQVSGVSTPENHASPSAVSYRPSAQICPSPQEKAVYPSASMPASERSRRV